MKINEIETVATEFAYDNCHKIYLVEDENDKVEAIKCGYNIYPIIELLDKWRASCPLRFISNWKLDTRYVEQGGNAIITLDN